MSTKEVKMRILKSIGLVVAGGLYVLFTVKAPALVVVVVLGSIAAIGLFIGGYFVLFRPKR